MHPIELLKTPFGPVCLVTPFEYSELEDPSPKHVQGYTGARLILSFQVHPDKELLGYNVEPYLSGVFNLFEQQLHDFGIFGIVTAQSLVLPCSYRDVVLGQFFMEQILKVYNFISLYHYSRPHGWRCLPIHRPFSYWLNLCTYSLLTHGNWLYMVEVCRYLRTSFFCGRLKIIKLIQEMKMRVEWGITRIESGSTCSEVVGGPYRVRKKSIYIKGLIKFLIFAGFRRSFQSLLYDFNSKHTPVQH